MQNRYKVGLKLLIDDLEYTLIEDNGNRGFFKLTDKNFHYEIKPTYILFYSDLKDCPEVKSAK